MKSAFLNSCSIQDRAKDLQCRSALAVQYETLDKLVGTRSCAIRHRTSEEGEHLIKLMGKSVSSDSAQERVRRNAERAKSSVETYSAIQRRTRGSASTGAGEVARSYHFYGAYQRSNCRRSHTGSNAIARTSSMVLTGWNRSWSFAS
jgi:hypothetical protein